MGLFRPLRHSKRNQRRLRLRHRRTGKPTRQTPARVPRIRMFQRIQMAPENSDKTIKITLDDLANVSAPDWNVAPALPAAAGAKVYGSINEPTDPRTQVAEE